MEEQKEMPDLKESPGSKAESDTQERPASAGKTGRAFDEVSPVVKILAILLQFTWGFLQNFVGFWIMIILGGRRHRFFRTALVTDWKMGGGMSLGMFVFMPERLYTSVFSRIDEAKKDPEGGLGSYTGRDSRVIIHEYGHTMQSLLFGPLYLFLFAIPSVLWANLKVFVRLRREKDVNYYRFYPERFANFMGTKVTGRESCRKED